MSQNTALNLQLHGLKRIKCPDPTIMLWQHLKRAVHMPKNFYEMTQCCIEDWDKIPPQ